ncbi:MAG: family 10 glycosylhydrolase [Prochloraceae cyanobacterium]|nr:family 10 glycosylhydrolase [Prochloraceae cyanobacterium]
MANRKRSGKLLKIFRGFVCGILAVLLILALHQAPNHKVATAKQIELRAVWLTNFGTAFLHHTTRLDEVLYHLAELNFNTIYPCVWNRAHTLFPSAVAQKTTGTRSDPLLTLPFQDSLKSIVRHARRQGIAVVPWFEYGLMAPNTSNLVQRHPEWITVTRDGTRIIKPHSQESLARRPQPLRNFFAELSGANLVWLNPMHPEVQQFLTDLIVEVVTKYDVDGIQLDDHFGLPVSLGYDPYTVKLYQQEHQGASPPQNPYNSEWMRWRANKLTQFITKISQAVKTKKPNCIVSISPNPAGFAYREYLQDWSSWVQKGIIDEVVVQVYRDTARDVEAVLKQGSLRRALTLVPTSIGLYSGSFREGRSIEAIAKQVEVVRKWGYSGVAFFPWESTLGMFKKDSSQLVEKTFARLFPTPSLSPARKQKKT